MTGALFDPGLQPERTELAWRRTALSIALGSVVAMRVLPEALGSGWWIAPGILGVLFAALLWGLSRRRYGRMSAAAREGTPGPGGAALLGLAVFVGLVGALATTIVIVAPLR